MPWILFSGGGGGGVLYLKLCKNWTYSEHVKWSIPGREPGETWVHSSQQGAWAWDWSCISQVLSCHKRAVNAHEESCEYYFLKATVILFFF